MISTPTHITVKRRACLVHYVFSFHSPTFVLYTLPFENLHLWLNFNAKLFYMRQHWFANIAWWCNWNDIFCVSVLLCDIQCSHTYLFIYLFINLLVFILGNRGEILKAIDFVHTVVYPILCTIQLWIPILSTLKNNFLKKYNMMW